MVWNYATVFFKNFESLAEFVDLEKPVEGAKVWTASKEDEGPEPEWRWRAFVDFETIEDGKKWAEGTNNDEYRSKFGIVKINYTYFAEHFLLGDDDYGVCPCCRKQEN
jgi:hypothetical protein